VTFSRAGDEVREPQDIGAQRVLGRRGGDDKVPTAEEASPIP
jgi:hypothetical protein